MQKLSTSSASGDAEPLRQDLGLDLLDRLRARKQLSEATALAAEAPHASAR